MIHVKYIKPHYIKVVGIKLRIVFAHNCFSILKDGEEYHFVPLEGKEVSINTETSQVENLSDIFVFQRGKQFIRLPIYQLLLISDIEESIKSFLEDVHTISSSSKDQDAPVAMMERLESKPSTSTSTDRSTDVGTNPSSHEYPFLSDMEVLIQDVQTRSGVYDDFRLDTESLVRGIEVQNRQNIIDEFLTNRDFQGLEAFLKGSPY